MVCRMTGRVFRVIEESRSPSGRYAIAWIASAPGVTFETNSVDGTVSVTGGEARNLLVRLRDGAIVALMLELIPAIWRLTIIGEATFDGQPTVAWLAFSTTTSGRP